MLSATVRRLITIPALLAALSACGAGEEIVATTEEGASCPWEAEALSPQLPIGRVGGLPSDFEIAIDKTRAELVAIYKPDSRPRSTQVLLRRYLSWGLATDPPMELQAELPYQDLATRWDHRLTGLVPMPGGLAAMWSQRFSPNTSVAASELWLQRLEQGSPLGAARPLAAPTSYMDSFAALYVDGMLVVASVEDRTTTVPNVAEDPRITLRRFDAALQPQPEIITLPTEISAGSPYQVQRMELRGDAQHLGLAIWAFYSDGSGYGHRFVLLRDWQLVDIYDEPHQPPSGAVPGGLAYGAGTFLRCGLIPNACALVDAREDDAIGIPVNLQSQGGGLVHALAWQHDRFYHATSSAAGEPAERLLGWLDVAGNSGEQLVWADATRQLAAGPATASLLFASADELLWIDDFVNPGATEELGVLLRLTRSCP